ncbi:TonB-dependent receptor [Massilia aurea]|uniref:TonB-dependent receptor plug domain-containing protein n=1 Tax=Massilia aurea TaxID=373040 RepID=UPI0034630A69
MRFVLTCLAVCLTALARAEPTITAPPQQVVVNGSQGDVEAGRDFVAGKIVIGKARIAASGLQNVGELLGREPSVSVGKDGRIGLLGLPGYTQILVDGMPPQGDTFTLDLVHVERIEIIKSSTAATGPIGIAGTINIIRRKAQKTRLAQVNAGVSTAAGLPGADLAWSTGGPLEGKPLIYSVRLSAMHKPVSSRMDYMATRESAFAAPALDYSGQARNRNASNIVNASGELTWNIDSAHTLTFSPEAGYFGGPRRSRQQRFWRDGSALLTRQDGNSAMATFGIPLRWDWRIDPDSTLSVKLNVNRVHVDSDALRVDTSNDPRNVATVDELASTPTSVNTNTFLHVDYATEFENGHALTAGAKFAHNRANNTYADFFNGLPDYSLSVLGQNDTARLTSSQLFFQDEWRINRTWAMNLGSSVERRAYRLREGTASSRPRFTMWAPSLHVSRKIGADRKRQLRLSVARSYRAPFFDELLWRPVINTFAPCRAQVLCGANTLDTADTAGNPALQPERALGVNLSYSHGIGKDSDVTLEAYSRDISNKTGYEIVLADVPWAGTPRYIGRQANLGTARIRGLNIEARLSGKDLGKQLARLDLHGSVGLADSALSDLPGPDNHISGQSPWRAKIGGSYTLQAVPVKLGVDASYLPDEWVRDSVRQRVYESSKLVLGMNASWTVSKQTRLVLNLDNLLSHNRSRIDEYLGVADVVRRTTATSNHSRIALRLETRL